MPRRTRAGSGKWGATSAKGRDAGNLAHKRAFEAKKRARKVVDLLEKSLELIAEDDPTQPAVKYVHTALCEAERRATLLEDWYQRTYPERLT